MRKTGTYRHASGKREFEPILAEALHNALKNSPSRTRTYDLAVNPDVRRDSLYQLSKCFLIQAADLRLFMNFSRFIASARVRWL